MRIVQEWLRSQRSRFGATRVNVAMGYAAFVAVAVGATSLATTMLVQARIRHYDGLTEVDLAPLARAAWHNAWLLVALLCVAAFFAIWAGIVRPFEAFRTRARAQLEDRSLHEALEALERDLETKARLLSAALEDNKELREAARDYRALERRCEAALGATVAACTDALILVGPDARIVDLNAFACEMLGCSRESATGRPIDQMMRLVDERKANPREYPLDGLTLQVLESLSTLPRVQTALLIDRSDREVGVVLTLTAIVDHDGHCVGGTVRIVRSTPPEHEDIATGATGVPRFEPAAIVSQFERRFDELLRLARSRQASHGFLLMRIDHLASVSDAHGYAAAEELLRRAAQIVAEQLLGDGESFVLAADRIAVLLPFQGLDRAAGVGEALREAVASRELTWNGHRIAVTVSVAAVAITPQAEARRVLIGQAETVLASAASGGNRVCALEPDRKLVDRRRQDQEWLDWIGPRLGDGRAHFISQHAAPLAEDGAPLLECYLRVEDDDGIWLTPGSFLPALERRAQTSLVDLWILRAVIDQVERQPELVENYAHICVNFSVESLLEPDFIDSVFQILVTSSVPGSRFCFEFDERSLALHPAAFRRFAESVRTAGAALALDRCRWTINPDLIREVRVDYVKFHESVGKRAMSDDFDRAQLQWLLQAAAMLDLRTVVCGVEDAGMLDRLKAMGVDYAQGVIVNKMGPLMA
ncbi:EAL domain-containing protein [Sinimarinibacterium flocculans]|nr:EAL domain-containing protein [Sinimarinibacterium flocculans]